MLALTALWGFQQVTVKWIAPDISLVMQAAIRSLVATALLFAWTRLRGIALFGRDGTLGLHFFVKSERLSALQWAGVAAAFCGIALAFADGFFTAQRTWVGDLCGVAGALLWAATTVLVRATRLAHATAAKTVFYQLAVSAAVLPIFSMLMHEKGVVSLTPVTLAALAYQGAVVAFATYLAWFWLLTRYYAARLSVLSFLTPMFGVASGVVLLGEPLSARFGLAALAVGAGIALVNLRR